MLRLLNKCLSNGLGHTFLPKIPSIYIQILSYFKAACRQHGYFFCYPAPPHHSITLVNDLTLPKMPTGPKVLHLLYKGHAYKIFRFSDYFCKKGRKKIKKIRICYLFFYYFTNLFCC